MFYEWKDIKGRKKEEKDRIPIFIFFLFLFSQMNLLSYILCYFMLAYRVKAIISLISLAAMGTVLNSPEEDIREKLLKYGTIIILLTH